MRSGVRTRPSRDGSSPISTRSARTAPSSETPESSMARIIRAYRNEPFAADVCIGRLGWPVQPNHTHEGWPAPMIRHPTASRSRRLGLSLPGIGALGRSERVAAALGARLDDGFHWFPDISPGGMERLDAVVVGPGGTWVLGYAEKRGRFRHRNGHWYRWNASTESWVPWDAVPVTGARVAGRRLSLYLERAALRAAVEVALVAPRGTDVSWDSAEEAH